MKALVYCGKLGSSVWLRLRVHIQLWVGNLATESFESYTEELKESKEGSKQNALCFGLEKGVTIC